MIFNLLALIAIPGLQGMFCPSFLVGNKPWFFLTFLKIELRS